MQSWQPSNLENVYSQFGEDLILEALFERIPEPQDRVRTCVEFGAWDGVHFSNTANLIKNNGWKGIFIESDTKRYRDLVNNYKGLDTTCINALVQFDGEFTLDNILTRANAPTDLDLISIDIDGCDYWILESIDLFLPKVFVVEFNPTIPNSVEYVQPRDLDISQGSSLNAIAKLAKQKGYELIATSVCNAFFVKECFAEKFLSDERTIDEIHNAVYSNNIWTGYDGTIMLERDLVMPWHSLKINQSKIQVLPLSLRKFPDSYSVLYRFYFKLFSRISNMELPSSTDV